MMSMIALEPVFAIALIVARAAHGIVSAGHGV